MTDIADLAHAVVDAVLEGQRAHRTYTAQRTMSCPPSSLFPLDGPGEREAIFQEWRETYPERDEASFTVPRVAEVLNAAGSQTPAVTITGETVDAALAIYGHACQYPRVYPERVAISLAQAVGGEGGEPRG